MSTFRLDEKLSSYVVGSCTPPEEAVSNLIRRTMALGDAAEMMIPVEQAGFLTMLTRVSSARRVIDVGTFTGLSALAFARGLGEDGKVVTCDVTDEWLSIASEHWRLAGIDDRIDFRCGPAKRTLEELENEEAADIVFLDADKTSYPRYCEAAARLLASGGLLILDNVLLHGTVVDPGNAEDELGQYAAEIMDSVSARLAADERFDTVMLPIADGMTIARKK
ncbi:caffeoyl-CoA O-methyltransferase [Actinopolyspora mzabensis]|uniref:Caffeoyl-CoA O-methyltransferase n=1 Tax=Actinopolyspora mzabensis TaxID=995066 RepID=A0A1G8Y644_ACTMZ|nr:class I SAM-dependent methyltransferase [Actinopolyspora mzabensis]SDJ98221.1 caffeoyl-CoA O-methyltransferase [Actinopolyspora mzabensis]